MLLGGNLPFTRRRMDPKLCSAGIASVAPDRAFSFPRAKFCQHTPRGIDRTSGVVVFWSKPRHIYRKNVRLRDCFFSLLVDELATTTISKVHLGLPSTRLRRLWVRCCRREHLNRDRDSTPFPPGPICQTNFARRGATLRRALPHDGAPEDGKRRRNGGRGVRMLWSGGRRTKGDEVRWVLMVATYFPWASVTVFSW